MSYVWCISVLFIDTVPVILLIVTLHVACNLYTVSVLIVGLWFIWINLRDIVQV